MERTKLTMIAVVGLILYVKQVNMPRGITISPIA
jgi:hypothetical protein